MLSKQTKTDVYEQITSALIAAIEEGTGKCEMPWHTLSSPINAATQKLYRGVNILMLWAAARKYNYSSQQWATYRQWNELGAQVRKSERSTIVVFWKFFGSQNEQEQQEDIEDIATRPRCFARAYHVFNAAQVNGYESKQESLLPESEVSLKPRPFSTRYGNNQARWRPGLLLAQRRLHSNAALRSIQVCREIRKRALPRTIALERRKEPVEP